MKTPPHAKPLASCLRRFVAASLTLTSIAIAAVALGTRSSDAADSAAQWSVDNQNAAAPGSTEASNTTLITQGPTDLPPGTPRFFNFTSPPGTGDNSGEPSIGINYTSEKKFSNSMFSNIPNGGTSLYYGGLDLAGTPLLRITFNDCSSPADALWEKKMPPISSTPRAAGDPILYTDCTTGRTFVSQLEGLTPAGSTTDITDDDGETFIPSEGSSLPSDVDHQTFGGGRFAPPLDGNNPVYPHAVYYASQSVADARAAVSLDGGVTFGPASPMYTIDECAGLHGHIKVSPKDGTAYVPNRGCGGAVPFHETGARQAAIVSEDNGITWAVRPIPDATTTGSGSVDNAILGTRDPAIGVGTDGTVYFGYQSADGHPRVAVSKDKGKTWSPSKDVGAAPVNSGPVLNTAFPAMVAGDGDRAAFAFYGTETGGENWQCGEGSNCADDLGQNPRPPFTGIWYLYVSTTTDGGKTWVTQNVTPGDPVQRGGICNGGTCRNLLDFFDIQVDKEGRIMVGWDDGCIGACVQAPPNSFSAKAVISRQTGGKRLFKAFDPVEPALGGAPPLEGVMDAAKTKVQLVWQEPDNGGSPITGYNVFRREGDAGGFTKIATVPQTSFTDTTFNKNAKNYYHVTALNGEGEGPFCKDIAPIVAPPLETICKAPGVTKLTDPAGDTTDAIGIINAPAGPGMDLLSFQLAQPYAPDGKVKLIFRINTDPGISPQPPGSAWFVTMKAPDGKVHGVHMVWKSETPSFESYIAEANTGGTTDGRFVDPASVKSAEPESHYDPDKGIVEIVVKPSDVGLAPGQTFSGFNSAVTQSTDPANIGVGATGTYDTMPDGLAHQNSFAFAGNATCTPNLPPVAALTATPTTGRAPLKVNFDASGSHDPDAGDSVASYTFSFGDGTPPVTQNTPTISHAYRSGGAFFVTCKVKDSNGTLSANVASLTVRTEATLLNISSRSRVLRGDKVMIGGTIITGKAPKTVVFRALGPSLQVNGKPVPGRMSNPTLELYDKNGLIASNDNWKSDQESEIKAAHLAPADQRESAIVQTLQPGSYTAVVRGKNGETGIALVEAYDVALGVNSRLANISTRAFVDTGDSALIGGFIAGTSSAAPTRMVVRGMGPSLDDKVPGALRNPTLEVRDSNGAVIGSNDNWKDGQKSEIESTGLQPSEDAEAAVVLNDLDPGSYTAIVRGLGGTGVGLVEVFNVGNP